MDAKELIRTECQIYKPAGLIQTPVIAKRFEIISVYLFGPLPETKTADRWMTGRLWARSGKRLKKSQYPTRLKASESQISLLLSTAGRYSSTHKLLMLT